MNNLSNHRHLWSSASFATRLKIAELFSLKRTGVMKVIDGAYVAEDGFKDADLVSLTKEKLEEFIGVSGELQDLFNELVLRLEHPEKFENPKVEDVIASNVEPLAVPVPPVFVGKPTPKREKETREEMLLRMEAMRERARLKRQKRQNA